MPPKKTTTPPSSVYQIKITLKGIRPPIWRRVLVPDNVTLADLHLILQVVMGWKDSHMHGFMIGVIEYGEATTEGFRAVRDERRFTLSEVVPKAKTKFTYTYDFGDEWVHDIEVEEILPVAPDQPLPQCLTGKRAGPPEDIGGPWGYGALIEAMAKPTHPERANFAKIIATFKPEAFDLAAINQALQKLR